MDWQTFKERKFDDIIRSMADYMNYDDDDEENFDCGYTQEDINACAAILDAYIEELAALGANADEARILACVEQVVKALNTLNVATDYSLIETDQREYLCDFILDAAQAAGLANDEDVTEEWREW